MAKMVLLMVCILGVAISNEVAAANTLQLYIAPEGRQFVDLGFRKSHVKSVSTGNATTEDVNTIGFRFEKNILASTAAGVEYQTTEAKVIERVPDNTPDSFTTRTSGPEDISLYAHTMAGEIFYAKLNYLYATEDSRAATVDKDGNRATDSHFELTLASLLGESAGVVFVYTPSYDYKRKNSEGGGNEISPGNRYEFKYFSETSTDFSLIGTSVSFISAEKGELISLSDNTKFDIEYRSYLNLSFYPAWRLGGMLLITQFDYQTQLNDSLSSQDTFSGEAKIRLEF